MTHREARPKAASGTATERQMRPEAATKVRSHR
eukprot:CAMPEP_0183373038 /NCGR_PEP_ID=MMETSP0164_2-20130417/110215_1 /TAXON_ID=221442 /ORGANISM="Coccolithus pelagicus ssp braarudi, Strain PLY182g" /LENGTH=32 /DNA_ID= /DNA_START= /DNA_END= /DNA_ORIENTATION=